MALLALFISSQQRISRNAVQLLCRLLGTAKSAPSLLLRGSLPLEESVAARCYLGQAQRGDSPGHVAQLGLARQLSSPSWSHCDLCAPFPSLPDTSSTCQRHYKSVPQHNHVDSDGCKSQGTILMNTVLLDNHDISIIGLEHLHNLGTSHYLHPDICLHEFTSICIPMKLIQLHPQQLSG